MACDFIFQPLSEIPAASVVDQTTARQKLAHHSAVAGGQRATARSLDKSSSSGLFEGIDHNFFAPVIFFVFDSSSQRLWAFNEHGGGGCGRSARGNCHFQVENGPAPPCAGRFERKTWFLWQLPDRPMLFMGPQRESRP